MSAFAFVTILVVALGAALAWLYSEVVGGTWTFQTNWVTFYFRDTKLFSVPVWLHVSFARDE